MSAVNTPTALQGSSFRTRNVQIKVLSVEQGEGQGARVRRSIGRHELRNFDPFLMLDEFKVVPPAGFPDHPHRGFETVTYILPTSEGIFRHEDFCGHAGEIGPGDLQWMTAGRGIVHAEMPGNNKISHGLQLWVNLAAKDKMCPPAYQELPASKVPEVLADGVKAHVIAGSALGIDSPVYTRTPVSYIHFLMEPNTKLQHPLPSDWNAFVYVLTGSGQFGDKQSDAHHTLALTRDQAQSGIEVTAGPEGASFVVIAGRPIGEPIVQHGPFVMNTSQEIQQAMADYYAGTNGFENAQEWESKIKNQRFYYDGKK